MNKQTDNFFAKSGTLEFILGRAWISLREAAQLGEGMIIRTNRMAGTDYELAFNGTRLANAGAIIAGPETNPSLCARITSLEARTAADMEPVRGDSLLELVPITVILATAKTQLSDLDSLAPMSWIDFGPAPVAGSIPDRICPLIVSVQIAGFDIARGVACVVGEAMGVRITQAYGQFAGEAPFRTSGNVLGADYTAEKVAPFDFARPDCFTRRQLESIAALHDGFLRSLSALSGKMPRLQLSWVDQLNFSEFLDLVPAGSQVAIAPSNASTRPHIGGNAEPKKRLLRTTESTALPVEQALSAIKRDIARPSGGATFVTGALLSGNEEVLCTALRDAWRRYGVLSPTYNHSIRKDDAAGAQLVPAYADEFEMVVVVAFTSVISEIPAQESRVVTEGALPEAGTALLVAYPLRTLESVLGALSV